MKLKTLFNRKWVVGGLVLLIPLFLGNVAWADEAPLWDVPQTAAFSQDRVLIKFKKGVQAAAKNNVLDQVGLLLERSFKYTGISVARIKNSGQSVEDIINTLKQYKALIEYAEPDYTLSINATIPNDPRFDDLWGLHNTGQLGGTPDADIDAPEAWDTHTGDATIVVGVIDTGIDYNHEDLAANVWVNPGEIAGNGIDDDGNGYIDDIHGINAYRNNGDPMDDNDHGTHVSGTIGAVGDNGIGVVGVNWNVKLMGLKFLTAGGWGYTSDAVQALEYAILMKTEYGINVRLTSNSWGGGGYTQTMYDAIKASGDADMLFVAAAGNDYGNNNDVNPHYPANYDLDNVISVASTDRNDNLSNFSNYGPTTVDLGAPGSSIWSTIPGNRYASFSGTSMATPHVSGAAAFLWTYQPAANAMAIKNQLMNSVDLIPSLAGKVLSNGRLNLNSALGGGNPGDWTILDVTFDGQCDGVHFEYDLKTGLVQGHQTGCETSPIAGVVAKVFGQGPAISYVVPSSGYAQVLRANRTWTYYQNNGSGISIVDEGTWTPAY